MRLVKTTWILCGTPSPRTLTKKPTLRHYGSTKLKSKIVQSGALTPKRIYSIVYLIVHRKSGSEPLAFEASTAPFDVGIIATRSMRASSKAMTRSHTRCSNTCLPNDRVINRAYSRRRIKSCPDMAGTSVSLFKGCVENEVVMAVAMGSGRSYASP